MTNNHDEFDDELLSAYVDGELTAGERALVEERLRADPQAAQLVEELRTLSSAVQSLPRETLGRDLRPSIFSQIDHAREDKTRHVIPLAEPLDPPRGFRRGFLWSTIAIAAALLIMFLQEGEQGHDRDVAAVGKNEHVAAEGEDRKGARKDGQLPNLGEMRAADAPRDAAKPAASAPAEPGDTAGTAFSQDAELERPADEPAAPEGQLAQLTAEPVPTEESAEREEAQAGVLAAAPPPPAPAAMPATAATPIGKPEPAVATVELAVKADNGLTRFKRHLAVNNFTTPAQVDEMTEDLDRSLGRETDGAAAGLAGDSDYALGAAFKREAEQPTVEVLVEGSPEQIERLVASCQTDDATFGEVNAPESLLRRELFSYRKSPAVAGGAGGGATTLDAAAEDGTRERRFAATGQQAASGPQAESDKQEAPAGHAWILSYGVFAGGRGGESGEKAKESLAESRVQLESAENVEQKADRRGGLETRQWSESLAKKLSEAPEPGRMRVRFVLRAAPAPQPATAAPANADP